MSKSTSKVPSSTIQEKYARLVVTKGARNPVWHAQKDSTLARFSDIQIKFSPTGTSHNLHKVVLDATFDDLELLNEHPLDAALEDLVLRLVYHTVLPAQVPLDLDQSIALWLWASLTGANSILSVAHDLIHINLWHSEPSAVVKHVKELSESYSATHDQGGIVRLFLAYFDECSVPASHFESVLPNLLDHWEIWNREKHASRPHFDLHHDKSAAQTDYYDIGIDIPDATRPFRTALLGGSHHDTLVRCGTLEMPVHAVVIHPVWTFFADNLKELSQDSPMRTETIKYEVVIPDFHATPLAAGALNPAAILPLLQLYYGAKADRKIGPLTCLLMLLNARQYGLDHFKFVSYCSDRVALNMDFAQVFEVLSAAFLLGAFNTQPSTFAQLLSSMVSSEAEVADQASPRYLKIDIAHNLQRRVAELTQVLHENLALASGMPEWEKLDTPFKHKIVAGGYTQEEILLLPTAPVAPPLPAATAPLAPPLPSGHFPIFIKTLTGKTILASAAGESLLPELKGDITRREGIPPCQQRIIHAGRQLEDDRPFEDYNVNPCDTMHLVLRLRGG